MKFSFMETFKNLTNNTHLKSSKDNLHVLEENIAYAQKMIKFGIWTYIANDDEVTISDEIYDIYESTFEKSFEGFEPYYHPDDKKEVLKNIDALIDGETYDIEFRIITETKKVKFIRERVSIVYDDKKDIKKIVGVIQDISKQRILERDLKSLNNDLYNKEIIEGVGKWKYNFLEDKYYISEELYNIHDIEAQSFRNNYKNLLKIIHKDDRLIIKNLIRETRKGKNVKAEYRILTKDHSIKHFQIVSNPAFNSDGEVIVIYGSIKDITKQKKLNKKLGYSKEKIETVKDGYQNIIQESKDGFLIINAKGRITFTGGSVSKIINCQTENLINEKLINLFDDEEKSTIKEMLRSVLKNSSEAVESTISLRCKSGEKKELEVFMRNQFNKSSVNGILFILRDITQKKNLENQVFYQTKHDSLTGLINRDTFLEKLNIAKKEAQNRKINYAFMMININDLKEIDLSFGYNIGNKLVLKILERLKKRFPNNQVISRYSEDNFAIIAKNQTDEKAYQKLAEKIIDILKKPFKIDSYELSIKFNIGVCVFPKKRESDLALKDSVKIALLRSKKMGHNNYKFYSSELDIQYYKSFTLNKDLKDAINNEELEVYYQPLVNLTNHQIIGAEALIRWNHPEWGLVSPGEFISIAEETGFIIEIGNWLLEEVFKDYKRWIEKGLPKIKIGVNFSAIQFFEKDFIENIESRIDKFNFNPELLIIEITENIFLGNKEKINQDLQKLRSHGIQIALDDFGTGYSSLSYLNSLNIDTIKIDRSFIKGIPSDFIGGAITKATIKLAEELNVEIVAEGIENIEQLNYLKNIDATIGQGYIYSKPVPLKEFEYLLSKKYCQPIIANHYRNGIDKDRRKFFRIEFDSLLETNMTILKMAGDDIDIGNTKSLIKNIGPGGLCFISNIRFPVEKNLVFKFSTNLVEKEIIVYGNPVWTDEIDNLEESNDKKLLSLFLYSRNKIYSNCYRSCFFETFLFSK